VKGFGLMIRFGFVIRFGLVIGRWGFVIWGRGFESFTPLAVDGLLVVASAEVLVKDGAVTAMERVLAPVRVAEMVDLKKTES
jgi:hypothetical protein